MAIECLLAFLSLVSFRPPHWLERFLGPVGIGLWIGVNIGFLFCWSIILGAASVMVQNL